MKSLLTSAMSRQTILTFAGLAFLKTLVVVGAAGLLFEPTQADAEDDAAMLRGADSNGDKAVTIDEARTAFDAQFKKMDQNGDGVVSRDEYVSARLAALSEYDTNNDGKITRDEVRARMKARFSATR